MQPLVNPSAPEMEARIAKYEQMLQKAVVALVNRDVQLDAKIAELSRQVVSLRGTVHALHRKLQGFEIPEIDALGRNEEAIDVQNELALAFLSAESPCY